MHTLKRKLSFLVVLILIFSMSTAVFADTHDTSMQDESSGSMPVSGNPESDNSLKESSADEEVGVDDFLNESSVSNGSDEYSSSVEESDASLSEEMTMQEALFELTFDMVETPYIVASANDYTGAKVISKANGAAGSQTVLIKDVDFTETDTINNNIISVVIEGIGNYKGTITKEIKISDDSVDTSNIYFLHPSSDNNLSISVDGGSINNSANIKCEANQATVNHMFYFVKLSTGIYEIVNVGTDKVVDVCGGSKDDGANIWQYQYNGTAAQQWMFYKNTDGSYEIINPQSGLSMSLSGRDVRQKKDRSVTWTLRKAATFPEENLGLTNDYYSIRTTMPGQNSRVDIAGASKSNTANAWIYSVNGTDAQTWNFSKLANSSDGRNQSVYFIFCKASGKVLDVSGASTANSANVWQYGLNYTNAQRWRVIRNLDRTYTFICMCSGKALDVTGATNRNTTNVQQYTSNATAAQKFRLIPRNFANKNGSAEFLDGQAVPYFRSSDYSSLRLGNGTVANKGSGITALSMVISFKSGNTVSPADIYNKVGKATLEQNYMDGNERLKGSAISDIASSYYGIENVLSTTSVGTAISSLKRGGSVVAFDGSKYSVLRGTNTEGFILINNPDAESNLNNLYSEKQIAQTYKTYYIFPGTASNPVETGTWTITQYADDSDSQAVFLTIEDSAKETLILIDGGTKGNEQQVRDVINAAGGHVDAWFITHYHSDHVSAFNKIYADPKGITIDKVYCTPLPRDVFDRVKKWFDTPESFYEFLDVTKNAGNVEYLYRNGVLTIGTLTISVLNAYDEEVVTYGGEDIPNNCSLVLKVSGKEQSMLICADAHSATLGDYLINTYGNELQCDYVSSGHHGNNSFPESFYSVVNPSIALFDAPEWLMTSLNHTAYKLKNYFIKNGVTVYDYNTAPNILLLK